MVEIVDGSGAGNRAQVKENNSLLVSAITQSTEHNITAEEEGAYFLSVALSGLDTLEFLTTEAGYVILLKTESTDKKATIEAIGVSANIGGGVVKIVKNPVIGTLANNTPVSPGNLNFSSTKTAIGSFNIWDGVGTSGIGGLTGGTVLTTHHINAGLTTLPIRSAMVLGQNDTIGIFFDNVTGGTINFEATMRFYFE